MNDMLIVILIEIALIFLIEGMRISRVNNELRQMMKDYIREFYKFQDYLETDEGGIEFVRKVLEKHPENTVTSYNEMRVILLIQNVNSNPFVTAKVLRKELMKAGQCIFQYHEIKGERIQHSFWEDVETLYENFEKCYTILELIVEAKEEKVNN